MIRDALKGLSAFVCLGVAAAAGSGQESKVDASPPKEAKWEKPRPAGVQEVSHSQFVSIEGSQGNAVTYFTRPYDIPVKTKWRYREPTCSPSKAQVRWAQMLPNYGGLRGRGLNDEEIVAYFAPNEVKCLEGDEVPEHLIPQPDVVYINERCKDGTCTTGYCDPSRRNAVCKDGRCPLPSR